MMSEGGYLNTYELTQSLNRAKFDIWLVMNLLTEFDPEFQVVFLFVSVLLLIEGDHCVTDCWNML